MRLRLCGVYITSLVVKVQMWWTISPPTLTSAGPPANGEYQHGLQLVALIG